MKLAPGFFTNPLAHRGLHDVALSVPENSPLAFSRAIRHGYGIELDVQLSSDGQAMVFHDDALDRLTVETGLVRERSAAELSAICLRHGLDYIPTLAAVLAQVNGQVPLLIEIKDQDGRLGADTGALETATAELLKKYDGPVAVMSFNPHAIYAVKRTAPDLALGLVTCDFMQDDWDYVPHARRAELTTLPDLEKLGATFISHDVADLGSAHVAGAKENGLSVFCWTVRSHAQEIIARKVADNITFEGYFA